MTNDNLFRLPLLPLTSCQVRRKINKCEVYEQCPNRINLANKKPCSVDPDGPRELGIFELLDAIERKVNLLHAERHDTMEIEVLIDAIWQKVVNIMAEKGI